MRMNRSFGNGGVPPLQERERSRTLNIGVCTSIGQHLNFKRWDVRSGGANRQLGE